MPRADILIESKIEKSFRVAQVCGMFDVPDRETIKHEWSVDIPIEGMDWQIGLIVGPSGSGKTVIGRRMFPGAYHHEGYKWPAKKAVVDGFPADIPNQEITGALSRVGFSSPPHWLKRFSHLSNGQQFRCELARIMLEDREIVMVDEFTSVVDRRAAKASCHAIAKELRKRKRPKLIAQSCHYDVIDWLQPDWIYNTANGEFTRRRLRQRPPIELEVFRVCPSAWQIFKEHHYLSAKLSKTAACYVAMYEGSPVAFASVQHFPHPIRPGWREHRTVCLPDFQGVGIGNELSNYIASAYAASGRPYRSVTSHPAMIASRCRSKLWHQMRKISRANRAGATASVNSKTVATGRPTSTFEYVGPRMTQDEAATLIKMDPAIKLRPNRNTKKR